MGIFDTFFKRLKSLINKKDLQFTIDNIHDILDDIEKLTTLYSVYMTENKPANQDIKYLIDNFYRTFENKIGSGKNLFNDISAALLILKQNLKLIETYVEKNVPNNTIGSALSFKKGFALAYINNTEFCLDYILKLIDFYVDFEVNKSKMLSKANIVYVEGNIKRFSLLFSNLTIKTDKFEKEFNQLPDILITDDNQQLVTSENESIININSFMGFRYSPIFFISKIISDYQINKYKERKETIKYLQLRLTYLQNENGKLNDPVLEQEIEYIKNRIEKIESKNYDVERDLQES
jgi:hypothetical protein